MNDRLLSPLSMPRPATVGGADAAPVVVVGTGPAGVRYVQELHRRDPRCPIVVYGREPWQPYDRVRLSSFLQGLTDWSELTRGLELPESPHVDIRLHCEVHEIDRAACQVRDSTGRWQPYGTLVLALGSRAHVPDLPGIGQAGVFVFRDLADAQALQARRARSARTIVLGGGLLGLEAARAMQRLNTQVTVLEHAPRLMARQLDAATAAELSQRLEALGLTVLTGVAVKAVRGHGRVAGVELRNGQTIEGDTLVVATGIVPNTALALDAQLAVGRGIRVDDRMCTSDPHVLAIGECAEHRGQVHGLVGPCLEQASVAVHTTLGGTARYEGTVAPTRLKVAGVPVSAVGRVDAERADAIERPLRLIRHVDGGRGCVLSVAVSEGRLVGMAAVGEPPQLARLQAAVLSRQRLWPWQARRLVREGSPWPADGGDGVCDWPADARVCQCSGVSRGELGEAIAGGCRDLAALGAATRAGTVCGSCRPLLMELLSAGGAAARLPAVPAWRGLAWSTGLAALIVLALLAWPGVAYWQTVQHAPPWHRLWTDPTLKQWSGYTVAALTALGLVLSGRKRLRAMRWGGFDGWRLVHVVLGTLALAGLAVHTGARLGARLDAALMLLFVALALVGAVSAFVTAWQHRLPSRQVVRWRRTATWAHILLGWPVPVLLALHVLKAYWF